MAGVVEAVGKNVTQFQSGDEVFGETIGSMQSINGGAFAEDCLTVPESLSFAEYVAVDEECLALKAANITFEQAASVPISGCIVLLNFAEVGELRPGQEVLVNGAGGGVGAHSALTASTSSSGTKSSESQASARSGSFPTSSN